MLKKLFYVGLMVSGLVFADHGRPPGPGGPGGGPGGGFGGGAIGITGDLDAVISDIDSQVDSLPPQIREVAVELLKQSDARLHAVIAKMDSFRGRWIQTNSQDCTTVCRSIGLNNAPSPEGALCVSGEHRVNSAIGKIVYNNGTWGSGCVGGINQCPSASSGAFCYGPGQKHDNDRTDRTAGCFCRR